MDCPRCKSDLVTSQRQEIEVYCCPKCAGVWVDSGDFNEIIMRSALMARPVPLRQIAALGDQGVTTETA